MVWSAYGDLRLACHRKSQFCPPFYCSHQFLNLCENAVLVGLVIGLKQVGH